MPVSTYLENALVNLIWRATAFGPPATIYVSLHSNTPGNLGANELSGNNYARASISTTGGFVAPTAGVTTNALTAVFPAATAPWNGGLVIPFAGMWDAAAAGNFLLGASINTPRAILTGDTARFDISAITVFIV